MLKWLYLDFNSYFASVEQQMQPHLRGKPVAVVPVESDSTCAIAASYEAKAFGIRTGTPIYEARRLCRDLICVLARHDVYVDYHHRAIEEIDRHIPVDQVCSIDEMACRLLSNEAPEPAARRIALSIKAGLAQAIGPYVRCSIGIAPNRYLAKVATDINKPDGLTVLFPADIPHCLLGLALRDLPGIGANMERRLNQAGIHTMHDLLALDRRRMISAWGSVLGERMWYELRGFEIPDIPTTRHSIGHSHVLAPDLRRPDRALYVARRLLLKACSRLRRMGYHAAMLSLSVRLVDGRRLYAERPLLPAQDSPVFLAALDEIWQHVVAPNRAAMLKKVAVTLHRLQENSHVQPDLFANLAGEPRSTNQIARSLSLSGAMDRLNSRFGRDTVLIGVVPSIGQSFSGAKIAFNRIPDREEFLE